MTPPPLKAIRTGRHISHPDGTIYEVSCPSCRKLQFHQRGTARCIFCNVPFQIVPFDIVRKSPVEPPEDKENP
jgi:hypothetical protein